MTYLYGDSTDSGLELNYIELLREFLDFAVQVMLSEHRIAAARTASDDRKREISAELERLRGLGATVASALEKAKGPNPKSSTDQSILALHRATEETLRRAGDDLKSQAAQAEQELVAGRNRERAANAKLIEELLLHHELPDSQNTVNITLKTDGSGYEAEVLGSCAQGLTWRFRAEVASGNRFAELVKISSLRPELSIELPEMSGFVRKSVKLKAYKLAPLYVTELLHEGQSILLKLRSGTQPDDVSGLDIRFSPTSPKVTVVRSQKGEESPAFHVPDEDAATLSALCKDLVIDAAQLVAERSKLLEVTFNKILLRDCPDPAVLIQRLVARIGPVIQGIAAHSLADTELVLKRVMANDRREEIFASKIDLLDKLRTVPPELRSVFAPLGLGDVESDVGDYEPTNRVDSKSMRAETVETPVEVFTSAPTLIPNGGNRPVTKTALEVSSTDRNEHSGLNLSMMEDDEEEATNVVDAAAEPLETTADAADELPPAAMPGLAARLAARRPSAAPTSPAAPPPAPASAAPPSAAPPSVVPPSAAPQSAVPPIAVPRPPKLPEQPRMPSQPPQSPSATPAKPTAERISKARRGSNSAAATPSAAAPDSIDVALAELEADN